MLIGGTSEIGLASLRALNLPERTTVVLAGRNRSALEAAAEQLPQRVEVESFEAAALDSHDALLRQLFGHGDVDLLLMAFGVLGDQRLAETSPPHAVATLTVNFVAHTNVLLDAAERMRRQGHGTLVVFSSVAGVRARRANFVYGASKSGLDALANGLADTLHGSGVRLILVRPGFVIGRMTHGMRPAPLAVTPEVVGKAVANALRSDRDVVWVPPGLRYVAAAMRITPRFVWRRLSR